MDGLFCDLFVYWTYVGMCIYSYYGVKNVVLTVAYYGYLVCLHLFSSYHRKFLFKEKEKQNQELYALNLYAWIQS